MAQFGNPRGVRNGLTFGGRAPLSIGILIALTVIASLVTAVGSRGGQGLGESLTLVGRAVLGGQFWRLVTWVFVEREPISLVFGCLALYWFGRDLAQVWGTRLFMLAFFGLAVFIALVTTAIGAVAPTIGIFPYQGTWPLAEALILAWAFRFPTKQMLMYFVLPLSGRTLIYFTLGGTALFAIFYGFAQFIPHFIAEATMLIWMGGLRRLWLQRKVAKMIRTPSHLRLVPKNEKRTPPKWLN